MCGQCSGEEEKSSSSYSLLSLSLSLSLFSSLPPSPPVFYLHDLSKLNDAIWLFVATQSEIPPSH